MGVRVWGLGTYRAQKGLIGLKRGTYRAQKGLIGLKRDL